jgi:hypothetical protein
MLTRYKHYESVVDLLVLFTKRLQTDETLVSGADMDCHFASELAEVTDLSIGAVTIHEDDGVTARVSGGKCLTQVEENRWESRYVLRAKGVTSAGETESEDVELVVYDSVERA